MDEPSERSFEHSWRCGHVSHTLKALHQRARWWWRSANRGAPKQTNSWSRQRGPTFCEQFKLQLGKSFGISSSSKRLQRRRWASHPSLVAVQPAGLEIVSLCAEMKSASSLFAAICSARETSDGEARRRFPQIQSSAVRLAVPTYPRLGNQT